MNGLQRKKYLNLKRKISHLTILTYSLPNSNNFIQNIWMYIKYIFLFLITSDYYNYSCVIHIFIDALRTMCN